jgi:hypothetical protein
LGPSQEPSQKPPQPSGSPQAAPRQKGVQAVQSPTWQISSSAQHFVPQATCAQTHCPALQVLFTPGQVPRQNPAQPSAAPQSLPSHAGAQHAPPKQTSPSKQQVPWHRTASHTHSPAWHASPSAQQAPAQVTPGHAQTPAWQTWLSPGQRPWHFPPQPSGSPQSLPAQEGVHAVQAPPRQACPAAQHAAPHAAWVQVQAPFTQVRLGPVQGPSQSPPQPSDAPQALPVQSERQGTHAPAWQVSPTGQQPPPHATFWHTH